MYQYDVNSTFNTISFDVLRGKFQKIKNKRQRILNAARYLFVYYGYNCTSLEDVAALTGFKKASLYHYIAGKEALMLELVENYIEECQTSIFYQTHHKPLPPHTQLSHFVRSVEAFYHSMVLPCLPATYLMSDKKR